MSVCIFDLNRAVVHPGGVQGESLPALSSISRQYLGGGGRPEAPNEEEIILYYSAGVILPGVEGVLVV